MLAEIAEGQIVAGKYRVERMLGRGGMGVVVAARHVSLDELVAIKLLLPEACLVAEAVARFEREARAAVRIKSEHVARVTDVGRTESGVPYMVMEYLDGEDLSAWLRQRGPLPLELAVDFVLQACVAVADAHSVGIVHRDLKPSNLFCVRRSDGQLLVKVLDFGISKLTSPTQVDEAAPLAVTKTAAIMGSPLYMSPEQVRSAKDVDVRSDIWSLGVVLYQLLTGTVPFAGEVFGDVAVKIATESAPLLSAQRPDVPPELDAVVQRCLAKPRDERFPNVAELALALLPFAPRRSRTHVERVAGIVQASGVSLSAPPPPDSSDAHRAQLPHTDAPWAGSTRAPAPARARKALPSVGLVLVSMVGLLTWRFWNRSLSPNQSVNSAAFAVTSSVSRDAPTASALPAQPQPEVEPQPSSDYVPETQASSAPTPTASPLADGKFPLSAASANRPKQKPAPLAANSNAPRQLPVQQQTRPDCDPPYTFDAMGRKNFKPECYLPPKH